MANIAIIGAGAFGFALAKHLSDKKEDSDEYHKGSPYETGGRIAVYDIDAQLIEHMQTEHSQKYFFPEIKLNDLVTPTADAKEAVGDADIILLSIPAQFVRSFLKENAVHFKDGAIIVSCSKGIEAETDAFISSIVAEEVSKKHTFAVLSGGMIASEFISGFGVFGAELACEDESIGKELQQLFSSKRLRVYLNDDVRGVEAAGALKNVVSIAAGFMDGLGYPYGSKTLIISLAAYEVECISLAMDSKSHTYRIQTQSFGNDYIMSTTGNTRNRYLGELIGKGMSPDDAVEQLRKENKTAEGYYTAKVARHISQKNNLHTPIIDMVYDVLYEGKEIKRCVEEIMSSDLEPTLDCVYHSC